MVEQAGVGEHEGPRADAHDAGVAPVGLADGVDELRRRLGVDVGAAEDDHRVGPGQIVHRSVLIGHEAGGHLGGRLVGHTSKSYQGSWISGRSVPKISQGTDSSKMGAPGWTAMATRCVASVLRIMASLPLVRSGVQPHCDLHKGIGRGAPGRRRGRTR